MNLFWVSQQGKRKVIVFICIVYVQKLLYVLYNGNKSKTYDITFLTVFNHWIWLFSCYDEYNRYDFTFDPLWSTHNMKLYTKCYWTYQSFLSYPSISCLVLFNGSTTFILTNRNLVFFINYIREKRWQGNFLFPEYPFL